MIAGQTVYWVRALPDRYRGAVVRRRGTIVERSPKTVLLRLDSGREVRAPLREIQTIGQQYFRWMFE